VAGLVLVEARDVSLQDVPSVVVGSTRATGVTLEPGAGIPFELAVPDAEPGHSLALRAHVSLDGTETVTPGDAISTTHVPLPATGDAEGLAVPVRRI
jgi:uncharacterized lipoprotein YbaY